MYSHIIDKYVHVKYETFIFAWSLIYLEINTDTLEVKHKKTNQLILCKLVTSSAV